VLASGLPRHDKDAPEWARGYSVSDLKEVCAMFKEHDGDHLRGAFDRYSELQAADDYRRSYLHVAVENGKPQYGYVLKQAAQPFKDFRGERVPVPADARLLSRFAYANNEGRWSLAAILSELARQGPLVVECWQEHAGDRDLVSDMRLLGVKIKASSSMRGVYATQTLQGGLFDTPEGYPASEERALALLPLALPRLALEALATHPLIQGGDFAAHYSNYQKGKTWSALALRGYYDEPERIEKPIEMNKKWRAEHADDLDRIVRDTPLRAEFQPELELLLAVIPCASFQRIRLMRLEPGGGELTRHADITDPEAGAAPGKVVRIHIPVVTNREVLFHSWDLDGEQHRLHMYFGAAFYLDVRKPHTAKNGGDTPRVHLVADVIASEETTRMLAEALEAPTTAEALAAA